MKSESIRLLLALNAAWNCDFLPSINSVKSLETKAFFLPLYKRPFAVYLPKLYLSYNLVFQCFGHHSLVVWTGIAYVSSFQASTTPAFILYIFVHVYSMICCLSCGKVWNIWRLFGLQTAANQAKPFHLLPRLSFEGKIASPIYFRAVFFVIYDSDDPNTVWMERSVNVLQFLIELDPSD